jgi:transcriptional regulator with XRE-family HTH domain
MPRVTPEHPRTRAEEILWARAMTRNQVVDRSGWHHSHVGRLMTGRAELNAAASRTLARILECPRSSLFEPIGAPIPPRRNSRRQAPEALADRLEAVLGLLDVDWDGLLRFLIAGDYSGLPVATARRLKEALASRAGRGGGG